MFNNFWGVVTFKNNSEIQKPTSKCDSIPIFSHLQLRNRWLLEVFLWTNQKVSIERILKPSSQKLSKRDQTQAGEFRFFFRYRKCWPSSALPVRVLILVFCRCCVDTSGLVDFLFCNTNSLCFLWFVSLIFWVRAMQMKFCLHTCKNFYFASLLLSAQSVFLLLGLRSLFAILMMGNVRPSKTLVSFFLFSLAPPC